MTQPPALQWDWHFSSGKLRAKFDPLGAPCAMDREALIKGIIAGGWDDLYRHEPAIDRFAAMAAVAKRPFALEIAERRSGECKIQVSDDGLSAFLTLTAPQGGAPMPREVVQQAIAEQGVVSGLLPGEITDAVKARQCTDFLIARGRPPSAGPAAQFQCLVAGLAESAANKDTRGQRPQSIPKGPMSVRAGAELMRRIPAQAGSAGESVLGAVIPAEFGVDTPFADDLLGVSISAGDSDLLLADLDGQPRLRANGIDVVPILELSKVSRASGDVQFDGTISVLGDVTADVDIHAGADVFVAGVVEKAVIEAAGNIGIGGGAIGSSDSRYVKQPLRLSAQGKISMLFFEKGLVETCSDLHITEAASYGEAHAERSISIGSDEGNGRLVGGLTQAGQSLRVGVLGAPSGTVTKVQVAYHPEIYEQIATQQLAIDTLNDRIEKFDKLLTLLEQTAGDDIEERTTRALQARTKVVSERASAEVALDKLQATLRIMERAKIVVERAMHPGVEIQIGTQTWRCQEPHGPGVLCLEGGSFVYNKR